VGPRAGLDRCGKSRPSTGFDPQTVQPVASRYTDYATRPTDRVLYHGKFEFTSVNAIELNVMLDTFPSLGLHCHKKFFSGSLKS
jgi:hypothetical protein